MYRIRKQNNTYRPVYVGFFPEKRRFYTYSYRRAVYEGYLCDHDAPFMLSTTKSREGIHFKAGEIVPKYDPNTQEIVNEAVLPDELDYDVEKFNDQSVVPDFNKKVFGFFGGER